MKNKKIYVTLILLIFVAGIYACSDSKKIDPNIDYYTCSMHPQIHLDHPGNCPICGMTLVPVYKQSGGQTSASASEKVKSIEISPDKQALIGVKPGFVVKRNAVKEIRAFGRVAFDPELAVAQNEFITILNSAPSLKDTARTRLKLMGMSEDEIRDLEKSRKASTDLYLPQNNGPIWIYATLYSDDYLLITPGMSVKISSSEGNLQNISGVVRGLDPIVAAQTRSIRARIEVTNNETQLKPDAYVDVLFQIELGEKLMVARSAVLDTGTRHLAFVIKSTSQFEAREVRVGDVVGDDVIILSGLTEGETVATSATFLIDSESELRGVIAEITP